MTRNSVFQVHSRPSHPAGDAELIIRVEGEVIRRQIALPQGATPTMEQVPIHRECATGSASAALKDLSIARPRCHVRNSSRP